jgi:hypothetical protein
MRLGDDWTLNRVDFDLIDQMVNRSAIEGASAEVLS